MESTTNSIFIDEETMQFIKETLKIEMRKMFDNLRKEISSSSNGVSFNQGNGQYIQSSCNGFKNSSFSLNRDDDSDDFVKNFKQEGVKEASDTNDNNETAKEFIYEENGLVDDVTVETVKESFEVENRLVDDVVKERSSTRLLTKGDLFVVNRKVGLADNSFEIGILTKGMVFVKNNEELCVAKFEAVNKGTWGIQVVDIWSFDDGNVFNKRDINTIFKLHLASAMKSHVVVENLWGDQIDVAAIMVVETNQKVVRSHTIVLEVTKFAMPKKFAREAIEKLLGLKLVLNTLMKSIVEPMSIECGKRGILESFNHGYLALDEFNQLRKQGLCLGLGLGLGDNMIAIAKESTEMEEREKSVLQDKLTDKGFKITTFVEMQKVDRSLVKIFKEVLKPKTECLLGVSSTSDSDTFGFNVLMHICSDLRYVEGWKYAVRYEVMEGIKENELVSAEVPDQCTPTQNMWLMFWGYRLRNGYSVTKFCIKDGGLSFVDRVHLLSFVGGLNLKTSPEPKLPKLKLFYTVKFNLNLKSSLNLMFSLELEPEV
ncbi:hypothetical protein Tco_0097546 [Tanacetum coccineum]